MISAALLGHRFRNQRGGRPSCLMHV
jgi:hypothetical protein